MEYTDYAAFNAAYGFESKAGFALTPLQTEDINQFLQWPYSLNTYEVGGGKTVVSTVVSLMRDSTVTVVAVPPILLRPWTKWLKKVSDGVIMYSGSPSKRKKLAEGFMTARWIVVSHAIFRDDFRLLQSTVYERSKTAPVPAELIVDEAHALKSVTSQLFKKVEIMAAGNRTLQMLTGTPINKPTDSYSYIKLKTPSRYRSMGHFEAIHVAKRDLWKAPKEYANLELMQKNLAEYTISRTKEEVHGYNLVPLFPDSEYDLSAEHMKLYYQLIDEMLLELPDGQIIDATIAQRLRHAAQQMVVNWDYFSGDPTKRSAAYDLLDQTLEETECHRPDKTKLIIWTKYVRSTESILAYLKEKDIYTVAAYGRSNSGLSIERFCEEEKVRVIVCQYQSANAGFNPQAVCSEALFLEGDTVSLYMRQAMGRIHRVGQTKVPRMRIAVARGTVQEDLFKSLLKNDDMVQKIEPTKKAIRALLMGDGAV